MHPVHQKFLQRLGDHIDLWNGWRLTQPTRPFAVYLGTGSDGIRDAGIRFWEAA